MEHCSGVCPQSSKMNLIFAFLQYMDLICLNSTIYPITAFSPLTGESLPKASAALRRRLVDAVDASSRSDPFVDSMHPPDTLPLRLVAGSVLEDPSEDAQKPLKGTSLLNHTLSLRSKLLKAVKPDLELAKDMQAAWEASVWAQAVIMSRGFHVPKSSDRLLLIPIAPSLASEYSSFFYVFFCVSGRKPIGIEDNLLDF